MKHFFEPMKMKINVNPMKVVCLLFNSIIFCILRKTIRKSCHDLYSVAWNIFIAHAGPISVYLWLKYTLIKCRSSSKRFIAEQLVPAVEKTKILN